MSKPIHLLCAALLIGIAPRLEAQAAQAARGQGQVTLPRASVARMVAVKKTTKGAALVRPSRSQRAPDPSKLVLVTGPNGERRYARSAKVTK